MQDIDRMSLSINVKIYGIYTVHLRDSSYDNVKGAVAF